jgi:hypothetical protein
MPVDGTSGPNPKRAQTNDARPKASSYDMFRNLQKTRLKAAEANRKRLLTNTAPATSPVLEE